MSSRLSRVVSNRRSKRGAAVFVVMLVIVLLSALGLLSVRAATLASRSSGFNRQLTQTHYVTDYAVTAAVAYAGTNPTGVKTLMERQLANDEAKCTGYDLLELPTCAVLSYRDVDGPVVTANAQNSLLETPTSTDAGSLSPAPFSASERQLEGEMRIELSDMHPARPVTGMSLAGGAEAGQVLKYVYVTVSATGMVRPQQSTIDTWDTVSATAAGVETSRAHVVIGPVLMAK